MYNDSFLAPSGYETICTQPSYPIFDVTHYGATGSGNIDDTVAIRSAITAATNQGSGIIFFPSGTYAVCNQSGDVFSNVLFPVIFPLSANNLVFQGDGPVAKTRLVGYMPGLANPVINWINTGDSNSLISRFGMFSIITSGIPFSNIQFRSLEINGQAGFTGDSTAGGSVGAISATISSGGSGYSINDILTLNPVGGSPVGSNLATFKVTALGASNSVVSISLITSGAYNFLPVSNPIAVTGGSGSGCKLNVSDAPTGDGWDESHKCIQLNGSSPIDNILIFNCNCHNWRGEVIYAGGSATNHVYILNGNINSSNASAVSMSANLILNNTIIGATGVGQVYNGIENFDFTGSQQTTLQNCTISNATNNGIVYLGTATNSLSISGTIIENNHYGILLSEAGTNITVQNCTFSNNVHSTVDSILGLYDGLITGFANITIKDNTYDNSGAVYLGQHYTNSDGIPNLVIKNNTLINGTILDGGFTGPLVDWSGFLVSNNIIGSGAKDINGNGINENVMGLWSGTQRLPGSINGVVINDFTVETTTILPLTDFTVLNANSNLAQQNVKISSVALSGYPTGFTTTLTQGSNTNWVINNDSSWNTWSTPQIPTSSGLTIQMGSNRLFNLASLPSGQAPTANAGSNQTINFGQTATLNGADSGTSPLIVQWSKVSGGGTVTFGDASLLNTTASFSAVSVYDLRLSVTNAYGNATSDVTINIVSQPPIVSAGPNQTIILGSTCSLLASASDNGLSLTYKWSVFSSPFGSIVNFSSVNALRTNVTFSKVGQYILQFSASNGTQTSLSNVIITVKKKVDTVFELTFPIVNRVEIKGK